MTFPKFVLIKLMVHKDTRTLNERLKKKEI